MTLKEKIEEMRSKHFTWDGSTQNDVPYQAGALEMARFLLALIKQIPPLDHASTEHFEIEKQLDAYAKEVLGE